MAVVRLNLSKQQEEVRGTAEFALDANNPRNQVITDLGLARKAADGRVQFECDVTIRTPPGQNGCLVLDVVNRGPPIALRMLGAEWLLSRGYTVVTCGWQHDLPPTPEMIGARLPEALDRQGRPLVGRVRSVQQPNAPTRELPLGDALSAVDFGPSSKYGIVSTLPAAEGSFYPQLVPAVDGDGNELAGIRHPDVSVPLGTYTGWQPRPIEIGGADMPLPAIGATIPFPRKRIQERYASCEAYLEEVRRAANHLVDERYLSSEDLESLVGASASRYEQFVRLAD